MNSSFITINEVEVPLSEIENRPFMLQPASPLLGYERMLLSLLNNPANTKFSGDIYEPVIEYFIRYPVDGSWITSELRERYAL